jgi:hypothetical protein
VKQLYSKNKKENLKIAKIGLATVIVHLLGILPAVGMDISAIPVFGGYSAFEVLVLILSAWLLYGLHKHKFF